MAVISEQIPIEEKIWFAFKTRPKSEKQALKLLEREEISAYLPLVENTRVYDGRIRKSLIPLISSHIFVEISRFEYSKVLSNQYISKVITVGDQLIRVREEEIKLLKKLCGEIESIDNEDNENLSIGDKVRIIAGKLTGIEGSILEIKNDEILILQLGNYGFNMNIEVSKKLVYN